MSDELKWEKENDYWGGKYWRLNHKEGCSVIHHRGMFQYDLWHLDVVAPRHFWTLWGAKKAAMLALKP